MRLVAAVIYSVAIVGAASACSVCFGDPDNPQSHGLNMAIFTLLGVLGGVMTFVVAFATKIALRIRRAELASASTEMGDSA